MVECYRVIVIGAGPAGLVIANGLAKAKKKVLLIDRGNWGGDCTNFGCVPSKSLIASAHAAHAIRNAEALGLQVETKIDADGALERVRSIVKGIRDEEEPEALAANGVHTLTGTARFIDQNTFAVDTADGEKYVRGKQIVLATGSSPAKPSIEGLDQVDFLTSENIFQLGSIPKRLAVLGSGPIGAELGQAFARLGAQVTIIEAKRNILLRETPEAQQVIAEVFRSEGIELKLRTRLEKVAKEGDKLRLSLDSGEEVTVDQLLVAVGRRPNHDKLDLDAAGVTYTTRGIPTDKYGRTNIKHIWAVGDATIDAPFTHVAENRARAILTSLILPGPFKKGIDRAQYPPRCTYVDPAVAATGLLETEAIAQHGRGRVTSYLLPLSQVDRAITDGQTEGFIKVVTKKWSSRILGATIVAPNAGDLLPELALAIRHKIPLRKLASLIHCYPTYSVGIRKIADLYLVQTILRRK